ncbi:MAG TPA: formate dehydrogenase accessory protein FdhE [Dehalococcoidia bacterium]|nr:formate dehydrogenase accessory protein FdhE [Dehalococcoidia bacterium]
MTVESDSKTLERLDEQEGHEGALPKSLEFYRGLLRIQSAAESRIGAVELNLSGETIGDRIRHGTPVLGFDDLAIDWSLLQNVFDEVAALFASYQEVLREVPENLGGADHRLSPSKEVVQAWYEGARLPLPKATSDTGEALLTLIIHGAFRPFLIRHCEALLKLVNLEQWRRGYCPICGGNPDFAFLDKERGGRWLVCSRCDAEWPFQRLQCPYCGTQNQDDLAYFTDDKGLYRLHVCERCRSYLKTIDLRQTEDEILLPLERYLTLDIDTQAHNDGYRPGSASRKEEGGETMRGNSAKGDES